MDILIKPKGLKKGDKVAVVSLSSGVLGESFATHQLEIGKKRLKALGLIPIIMPNALKGVDSLEKHPEWRAEDLKEAFMDPSIKGIICAIGGDDTYRLLPYLMEDEEFIHAVQNFPKIFTGFSDTTINHLMFHRLGMESFYGPNFLSDIAELAEELLPYTKRSLEGYFEDHELTEIPSTEWWYEERTDFSSKAIGTERKRHFEENGIEVLSGKRKTSGRLLGGCLESLCDSLTGARYEDEPEIIEKYKVFPWKEEWNEKILFLETSEERPTPEDLRSMLMTLKDYGVFSRVNGVLIGKPQNNIYYEEYKSIYKEVINDETLPVLYNLPFGHACPRCLLPYGIEVTIDTEKKSVKFNESYFA